MNRQTSRTTVRLTLSALFVIGSVGLALAQDVTYNSMPGMDFTKFNTYKWITIQGAQHPDRIVDE